MKWLAVELVDVSRGGGDVGLELLCSAFAFAFGGNWVSSSPEVPEIGVIDRVFLEGGVADCRTNRGPLVLGGLGFGRQLAGLPSDVFALQGLLGR